MVQDAQNPRDLTEAKDSTPGMRLMRKSNPDMLTAASAGDVMELRKQETRRRTTYMVVGTLCLVFAYLVVFGGETAQNAGLAGLLGLAGPIVGFYFGAKQTGE